MIERIGNANAVAIKSPGHHDPGLALRGVMT